MEFIAYWDRKQQVFTYNEPFNGAQWNLGVGLVSQVIGQGEMASRGGAGWILGKISSLNVRLSIGRGCGGITKRGRVQQRADVALDDVD